MYKLPRTEFYQATMENDGYTTVRDFRQCVLNKPHELGRPPLQLFTGIGPLEFVAMSILGPLLKTSNRNQLVLVMKDCDLKVTRAVPKFLTTATHIAWMLLTYCITPCGIPEYVLKDHVTVY